MPGAQSRALQAMASSRPPPRATRPAAATVGLGPPSSAASSACAWQAHRAVRALGSTVKVGAAWRAVALIRAPGLYMPAPLPQLGSAGPCTAQTADHIRSASSGCGTVGVKIKKAVRCLVLRSPVAAPDSDLSDLHKVGLLGGRVRKLVYVIPRAEAACREQPGAWRGLECSVGE